MKRGKRTCKCCGSRYEIIKLDPTIEDELKQDLIKTIQKYLDKIHYYDIEFHYDPRGIIFDLLIRL